MASTTGTFESLVAFATALKESHEDPAGMPDTVIATREGAPIAVLQADSFRALLPELPVLTRGLAPDVVGLVVEGVLPLVPRNPVTGATWQRGEAAALWESGEGISNGWVTEAQLVTAVSRDSQTFTVGRSFRVVDDEVTWMDELPSSNEGLLRILASGFAVPVLEPSDVPDMTGLMVRPDGTPMVSSEDPRIDLDSIVLRLLARRLPTALVRGVVPDEAARDEDVAVGLPRRMCVVHTEGRAGR